jgi:hypothetical protein
MLLQFLSRELEVQATHKDFGVGVLECDVQHVWIFLIWPCFRDNVWVRLLDVRYDRLLLLLHHVVRLVSLGFPLVIVRRFDVNFLVKDVMA